MIEYLEDEDLSGLIMTIDFEKAKSNGILSSKPFSTFILAINS